MPRALLLAAAVIAAGEIVLATALPRDPGRHRTDEVLARLGGEIARPEIAVWGDSVTAGSLDGVPAAQAFLDLSSTQAISTAGVYYTWRRLVEGAGAPDMLVLVVRPESWTNDLDQVFTPAYFTSCFVRPGDALDFARTTGRLGIAAGMFAEGAFVPPSLVRQGGVRQALNDLRGVRLPPRRPLRPVDGIDPRTADELRVRAALRGFQASRVAALYLPRIVEETAAHGTHLVLMTPALPRSVATAWAESGYLKRCADWLRAVVGSAHHVTIEDPLQFADHPDDDMYDGDHLKPDGMRPYGERVAARIRAIAAADAR